MHKKNIRKNKRSVPWWTAECKEVIRNKRSAWKKYKRNKNYTNFISSITQWMPVTTIWKKIHKIAGKYVRDNVPVLNHKGEMIADTIKVADILTF